MQYTTSNVHCIFFFFQFASTDRAEEISKFFMNIKDVTLQTALKRSLKDVLISMRWIDGIRSEPKLAQTVHELLHKT
jgi:puromycin-sensitive aminopeptidase